VAAVEPATGLSADLPDSVSVDAGEALFPAAAREAAVTTALPLLGTYFSSGNSLGFRNYRGVSAGPPTDDALEELVLGLRLRVGLAAAQHLLGLLRSVLRRPNFRYRLVPVDSVGVVTGQLDTQKYLERLASKEVPFSYPTVAIERAHLTPENVLTTYAAVWLEQELRSVTQALLLPKYGPELRAVGSVLADLRRVMALPAFSICRPAVRSLFRQRNEANLITTVERRLSAGHVAEPAMYRAVVDWLKRSLAGEPLPELGDIDWQFYDERFDTKLFEIWCLRLVADELLSQLGPPLAPMAPLTRRASGPLLEWHFGPSRVRLYFQAALAKLGTEGTVRWQFTEGSSGYLRGFPDLAIEVRGFADKRTVILVDPKLRQRASAPAEEIYKILGYFGNLRTEQPPLGAIIYYQPGGTTSYRLETDNGGVLYALGVDPVMPGPSRSVLAQVAQLTLAATGISDSLISRIRAASDADPAEAQEIATAVRQEATVQAMLQAAAQLPEPTLNPYRKSCATLLANIWPALSAETQTMLVTAEYFGMTAPDDADHSGPLLGLAATCERFLYERLLSRLIAHRAQVLDADATFGAAIRWISDAGRTHPRSPEGDFIRSAMSSGRFGDLAALSRLTGDLRQLNVRYRIPAAHRDVVSHDLWVAGRDLVVNPATGLLVRLARALGQSS
jgi:hypothetical protein